MALYEPLTYLIRVLYWATPSAHIVFFYKHWWCSLASFLTHQNTNMYLRPHSPWIYKILRCVFPMSFSRFKDWKLRETCVDTIFLYVVQWMKSWHMQKTIYYRARCSVCQTIGFFLDKLCIYSDIRASALAFWVSLCYHRCRYIVLSRANDSKLKETPNAVLYEALELTMAPWLSSVHLFSGISISLAWFKSGSVSLHALGVPCFKQHSEPG